MFTGIIEELGIVLNISKSGNLTTIQLSASLILEDIKIGDSIAVNGVCLTITDFDSNSVKADIMNISQAKSNLKSLHSGCKVNLERALTLNTRLGGHLVTGHVDSPVKLLKHTSENGKIILTFALPPEIKRYITERGSVTLNGVSLTLSHCTQDSFSVSLIPETWRSTNIRFLKTGSLVNLEVDIIARYLDKIVNTPHSGVSSNNIITKLMQL